MSGLNSSIAAVTPAVTPPPVVNRPVSEPRPVEATQPAGRQPHTGGRTLAPTRSSVEQLVASARQFAEVLDSTGNIAIATSVSGFRSGRLDLYA